MHFSCSEFNLCLAHAVYQRSCNELYLAMQSGALSGPVGSIDVSGISSVLVESALAYSKSASAKYGFEMFAKSYIPPSNSNSRTASMQPQTYKACNFSLSDLQRSAVIVVNLRKAQMLSLWQTPSIGGDASKSRSYGSHFETSETENTSRSCSLTAYQLLPQSPELEVMQVALSLTEKEIAEVRQEMMADCLQSGQFSSICNTISSDTKNSVNSTGSESTAICSSNSTGVGVNSNSTGVSESAAIGSDDEDLNNILDWVFNDIDLRSLFVSIEGSATSVLFVQDVLESALQAKGERSGSETSFSPETKAEQPLCLPAAVKEELSLATSELEFRMILTGLLGAIRSPGIQGCPGALEVGSTDIHTLVVELARASDAPHLSLAGGCRYVCRDANFLLVARQVRTYQKPQQD